MPTFVDDDIDRGYRNVTGPRARRIRGDRRAHASRARLAAPPAAPSIRRRRSAIRRTHPSRRTSRTACIRSKANIASQDGLGVRANGEPRARRHRTAAGRLRPRGIRLCTHAAHQRRRAGGSGADRHARAQLRHAAQRRKHARAILRHGVRRRHAGDAGLRAGPVRDRPARARDSLSATWITKPSATKLTWNAEFGAGVRQRHAHHAERRQGLPRARQHRPLRLRRQSGSRPGSVASRSSSRCARS